MCLKIREPWLMPEETEQIGQMLLGEASAYRLIGEQLFASMHEGEFADLYPAERQPGLSPVLLVLVTVF